MDSDQWARSIEADLHEADSAQAGPGERATGAGNGDAILHKDPQGVSHDDFLAGSSSGTPG